VNGRLGLAAFGALMIGAAPVTAQTVPLRETADAVASDLALCSAFYEAELTCLASTLDGGSINALQTGKSLADQYGVLLGKRAGLSGREVTMRFERARAGLGMVIGQSCDGLATIANQYATACASLVQDPTRRFNGVAGGSAASGFRVQGQ
jgi:hypothetical protein